MGGPLLSVLLEAPHRWPSTAGSATGLCLLRSRELGDIERRDRDTDAQTAFEAGEVVHRIR
jgi:hypothetical protein